MSRKLILLPLLSALMGCGLPFNPSRDAAQADIAQTETVPIPLAMMGALQEDLEIGEVQAAAIIGNLAQETGNFTMLQQVGGTSFGYSQWLGPRKRAFLVFAEENGGPHSFEANYGFLLHEIETEYPEMVQRLRQADDLNTASRIFMREFLRPSPKHANLPGRVRYAQAYLSAEFDGAGCVGEDHVIGDRIRPCPEASSPDSINPVALATEVLLAEAAVDEVIHEITPVAGADPVIATARMETPVTTAGLAEPEPAGPDEVDMAAPADPQIGPDAGSDEPGLLRLAARLFRPMSLHDM